MAIFAVLSPEPNAKLETAVRDAFPDSFYKITPAQFLVSAPKLTTNQVSEKLSVTGGGVGRALIIRFSSYTGWHSKDMWEWIGNQTSPTLPSSFDPLEPSNE